MKIVSLLDYPPKNVNWLLEVNSKNYKNIQIKLKNYNYYLMSGINFEIIFERVKMKKIWIINNDSIRGDNTLTYFYSENLLKQELLGRKQIYLK